MVIYLNDIVMDYLSKVDISPLGLDEVYLNASISWNKFYDPSSKDPEGMCIAASINTDKTLTPVEKTNIEKIVLKQNPYTFGGKDYPVHLEYGEMFKAF